MGKFQKIIYDFLVVQIVFLLKQSWWPQKLKEPNITLRFIVAFYSSILITGFFIFGIAIGMEIKNRQNGNEFSLLNLFVSLFGAILGQITQALLINLFI